MTITWTVRLSVNVLTVVGVWFGWGVVQAAWFSREWLWVIRNERRRRARGWRRTPWRRHVWRWLRIVALCLLLGPATTLVLVPSWWRNTRAGRRWRSWRRRRRSARADRRRELTLEPPPPRRRLSDLKVSTGSTGAEAKRKQVP